VFFSPQRMHFYQLFFQKSPAGLGIVHGGAAIDGGAQVEADASHSRKGPAD
jgi:hypothetical protein